LPGILAHSHKIDWATGFVVKYWLAVVEKNNPAGSGIVTS
jgi:hypothetical protein